MMEQLRGTIAERLNDGPFIGQKFFMDPHFEDPTDRRLHCNRIPVKFSYSSHSITGLELGSIAAFNWEFFIPEGPERTVIRNAILLEKEQDAQTKYHLNDPFEDRVKTLKTELEISLDAIIDME